MEMGRWLGFALWALLGAFFVGMGIYDCVSKKERPFGFWANAKPAPVTDVKKYNRALGKLWLVFGTVFILLGLPLLSGSDSAGIIIPVLGAAGECVVACAVYTVKIEGKYRKNKR